MFYNSDDLEELDTPNSQETYTSEHIRDGHIIPAIKRIELFSPDQWEEFVEEWANGIKNEFKSVKRHGGAGDKGRDVIGFYSDNGFQGDWVLFQCKKYDKQLTPSDVWTEFGKVIYHSYNDEITPPQKYYFMSPKGLGLKLQQFLDNPLKLKEEVKNNWLKYCASSITSAQDIKLEGDFLKYFDNFNFSIFGYKTVAVLVKEHATTPYHASRFGGGLPPRSKRKDTPAELQEKESVYLKKLFDAYSDYKKTHLVCLDDLSNDKELKEHYVRSRNDFFSAEALANFARDNVPKGTFEDLQEEVYDGVIDICQSDNHKHGYDRLQKTTSHATSLPLDSNMLKNAVRSSDRKGICHQLANDDRLFWVKK